VILVDTSIWVRHFRQSTDALLQALEDGRVFTHDFLIGELVLGALHPRAKVIDELNQLPKVMRADNAEVLALIDAARLSGSGIGYIDAHLLASLRLHPQSALWTGDLRLIAAARRCEIAVHAP
jgi:predicted nucleic acid-binding protein